MHVVVIGGGVIGLWCARDLLRAGVQVTVLEEDMQPATSSPASAGWVVPALSAPLSGPGTVGHAVRALLRGEAAFSFGRPSLTLARWLRRFLESGSAHRRSAGLQAVLELSSAAVQSYETLADGSALELHQKGLLLVARRDEGMHEAGTLMEEAAAAGYSGKYDLLDGGQLTDLEPGLAPGLLGGLYARDEAYVRPEALLATLREQVRSDGGALVRGVVGDIVASTRPRWTACTDAGPVSGDSVVVAAGVWSRPLLRRLGIDVPILPAAGVSLTFPASPPGRALKLMEPNIAVTPFDGGGVRVAGGFALGAFPDRPSSRKVRRIAQAASTYLRSAMPASTGAQVGLRPSTPDSLPVIGEMPSRQGLFVAAGHGMLGLTLAPGTAAEITSQVVRGTVSPQARAFDPARFG